MPLNLNDADKIKELIVQPMIDALRLEIKPLVDMKQFHEARLVKLENNQNRALIGWGVFASGIAIAVTASWEWVKSMVKVKIG